MGSPPALTKTAAAVLLLILLLTVAAPPSAAKLSTFPGKFGPFNDTLHYSSILHFDLPATISNDALQVTPDSISAAFKLSSLSGRVLYNRPFKLWPKNTTKNSTIASFNSSFLVNLYAVNNSLGVPGEGLAFVVAPDLSLPPNSYGQYLGLTNSTTDGHAANRILAVELDTFKEDFDPDANHIGLNINSVRSNVTASLTPLGLELCPQDKANFFVVWVQYDGIGKVIEVYIAQQENKTGPTPARPASPVLRSNLDLRAVVSQFSYFGFSASTGDATQLNCVLRWNLTVQYFTDDDHTALTVAATVSSVVVLALAVGVGLLWYYKKKGGMRTKSNLVGALMTLPGMPREFEFKELKKATGNFDEKNKLGQGAYGVVYRGCIPGENLEVAVKWFLRESIKGEDDFLAELTIINRLRHRNLVRLLGWCHKNGKLLLVYDFMPNGSLDQHLFVGVDTKPLSWDLRYKVIYGVASALHYLHDEYDQKVVHRDLKASNILLDCNFNARLGDFGLARALDNEKTSYAEAEGVLGTMGYIAPECFHTGKATQQSDIYAFGAVLLEVVCGLRPGARVGGYQCLVDWVWSMHRDRRLLEAVDPRIGEEYVEDEAKRVLLLGLACSHPIAGERPMTEEVVQMISGSVPVPHVPPFKPAFIWPSMPRLDDNSSMETIMETRSFTTSEWTPRVDCHADNSDNFNLV